MQKQSQKIDMINGPLLKNIIRFSIPLMVSSCLQMLFNSADTIIVGKFSGQEALAAVGATGSLIFFMIAIFNGLSIGSNVVIAHMIGRKEKDGIHDAVHTSYFLALSGGLFLTILGFLLAKPLLSLVGTPDNIIDLSVRYMRIYFLGSVFMLVYNFGGSILRSEGDTKRPTYYLAISGVLNVFLNILFVVGLEMSVAGVAIATVISQAIAAILVTRYLMKDTSSKHLNLKDIKFHKDIAKEMISIGVPAGLQGMLFSISNIVIQSSVNSFGSVVVAGNSAAVNIEGYVYIGMDAFIQAAITFTSQNVGARNKKNIRKILLTTMWLTILSGFLVGFLGWFNGDKLLSLFTNDQAVIDAGKYRLQWVCLFLFINGWLDVFVGSMRGMGHSNLPTIVTLTLICGLRLAYLWGYFPHHHTLANLYLCFPISWIVTLIAQAILWLYYYKKFDVIA